MDWKEWKGAKRKVVNDETLALKRGLIDCTIKKKERKKRKLFLARDNVNAAFVSVFLSRAP